MSRGVQNFRQSDAMKAIKAAKKAGLPIRSVEIQEGKITIIAGKPDSGSEVNEWDNVR